MTAASVKEAVERLEVDINLAVTRDETFADISIVLAALQARTVALDELLRWHHASDDCDRIAKDARAALSDSITLLERQNYDKS